MDNEEATVFSLAMSKESSHLEALDLQSGDKVLILGGYGVRNVGDEAILAGLIRQLPPDVLVKVVSQTPRETSEMHRIDSVSPLGAVRALLHCDALIVGGGGIFSGHMGPLGSLIPVFSLLAKLRGVRVAFHGVGVYPSTPKWVQWSLRALAPRLVSFTVRDRASVSTLKSWGIKSQQISDLSTFLPPASSDRGAQILQSIGLKTGIPTVGMCLTAAESHLQAFLLSAIPKLIEAMPDIQFCFVPMSHHPSAPRHNDLLLAQRIRAVAPHLAILETWHDPSEVLALFNCFDVVVCMRYHSLLFAQRAGAAIVPIPYAKKCESWMEENFIAPMGLSCEALVDRVNQEMARSRE